MGVPAPRPTPFILVHLFDAGNHFTPYIPPLKQGVLRRFFDKRWRGFDVRHLRAQAGREFAAFDVFAALEAGAHLLTQETLDFLTLRDVPGAALEVLLVAGEADSEADFEYLKGIQRDLVDLTMGFRRQMVEEAAPHRHQVAVGAYVLEREPLHLVDTALVYDRLRLVITPGGILYSLISGSQYVPCFWSPEGTHTCQVWLNARAIFVLDALLACIWRDACIVRRQFVAEQRGKKGYEGKPRHHNPKVLPRTIYVSTWSTPADRATIREVTRNAHHVSACYPRLPEGHVARDAAERAAEYHWPPPPEGRTFRKPTTRGEGTPQAKRVVCRGLQVARITLGENRKFSPSP